MSSNPDKVILFASLGLAIAAGAYFVAGATAPTVKEVSVGKTPPVLPEIKDPTNPLSVWNFPKGQRALPKDPKENKKDKPLVLHVFNSPKIYFKPPSYFTIDDGDPAPKPYPFELKDVYQKPFRIQFGSYSKIGDEVKVYLKDLESGKQIEVQKGDKLADQGIEIRDVNIEDVSAGGGINKIAHVEIYDTRSRRTYKLVEKEPEIKEPTWYAKILEIATKKETEVILGGKVLSESVPYLVKSLDDGTKTVSLEHKLPDQEKPTTTVLTITTKTKP